MTACQNTPKTPALDMANFDLSVAPNADFYEYATGGWQKNNPLKPEYARYGSFDILRDNNEKRINELFSGMTQQKAEPGSVKQKISDLYKMGLDSVRLNAEGAAPIKAAVDEILAIGDRSQLTAAVARLHSSIANPFFGVGVQSDLMNSDINALYASQPDLIMGDRDYYLDPENESIRTAYKEYLGKIFRLSGVPEADIDKAVAGVLSIETKLAEKNWSSVELRNIPAMYNPTKKADFEKAYDAIDWAEYYKTMGIGDFEQIIVTTPSALANANELMKTAPLEEIRYYLAAQYIGAAASYLSDDFINASFDFFGRVMSGKQEQKPRWKRAMSVPNGTLSEAVGEMYVAKYFPEKDKVRMLDMVKNLQTALGQHIAALDWMSDATKAKAQEKLAAFTVKIGYPDKWKDYTTLKIDPAKSYWENIVEANAWYTSDNISKLGKPVDKDEWHMSPQTVNAYYNPTTNEICFPAAILQPPFYNPDADDAETESEPQPSQDAETDGATADAAEDGTDDRASAEDGPDADSPESTADTAGDSSEADIDLEPGGSETESAEIDRLEYEYGLLKKVEDYRAGRLETVTLDELEESLDLASRGRQGHPAFDEDSDDDDDSDDYEEDDSMFADLF